MWKIDVGRGPESFVAPLIENLANFVHPGHTYWYDDDDDGIYPIIVQINSVYTLYGRASLTLAATQEYGSSKRLQTFGFKVCQQESFPFI